VLGDRAGGVEDKAHIGLAVFVERGGDADKDGVGRAEFGEVGGGLEASGLEPALDEGGGKVVDVAFPGPELSDFSSSMSKPTTGKPAFINSRTRGRPT